VELIVQLCSIQFHKSCPASWKCHQGTVWEGIRVAIPPVLIPDTRASRRGLAYHKQGVVPWTVGEQWSVSKGKECPGPARIRQFELEIIPLVQNLTRGSVPKKEDIDVDTKDPIKLGPGNIKLLGQPDDTTTVGEALVGAWAGHRETQKALGDKIDKQTAILAEVRDGITTQNSLLERLVAVQEATTVGKRVAGS
jgi:hypothetical protein